MKPQTVRCASCLGRGAGRDYSDGPTWICQECNGTGQVVPCCVLYPKCDEYPPRLEILQQQERKLQDD